MNTKRTRRVIIRSIVAFSLAGLSGLAVLWARGDPAGVARLYGPWSRWVSNLLSRVFLLTELAVAEYAVYLLFVAVLVSIAFLVRAMIRQRSAFPLLIWLSHTALAAVSLVTFFLLVWGLNYFAPPLAGRLTRDTAPKSVEELYDTAVWLRDEMNRLADTVPRGADNVCEAGTFATLAPEAPDGYDVLAARGDAADTGAMPPKRMTASVMMSRVGLAGIYMPFTGEAIVSTDVIDAHLPFTMCHELAHRMGYAPEDEANFIAFLACDSNPNPIFRYSGYHLAFIYCSNALAAEDQDRLAALWAEITPPVMADIEAQSEHLKQYEGPVRDFGESVNNAYLQTMDQPEGVKSYGRVVDLLIAEHAVRFGT